jgi:hypothetical protein
MLNSGLEELSKSWLRQIPKRPSMIHWACVLSFNDKFVLERAYLMSTQQAKIGSTLIQGALDPF